MDASCGEAPPKGVRAQVRGADLSVLWFAHRVARCNQRRMRMMGWFRKKTPEPAADEFHGIMVTLKVGGEQSLFIMLGADGSINRVGTGAVDNAERDMFIGRTDPALFL